MNIYFIIFNVIFVSIFFFLSYQENFTEQSINILFGYSFFVLTFFAMKKHFRGEELTGVLAILERNMGRRATFVFVYLTIIVSLILYVGYLFQQP